MDGSEVNATGGKTTMGCIICGGASIVGSGGHGWGLLPLKYPPPSCSPSSLTRSSRLKSVAQLCLLGAVRYTLRAPPPTRWGTAAIVSFASSRGMHAVACKTGTYEETSLGRGRVRCGLYTMHADRADACKTGDAGKVGEGRVLSRSMLLLFGWT